jgi:hypothetical protein
MAKPFNRPIASLQKQYFIDMGKFAYITFSIAAQCFSTMQYLQCWVVQNILQIQLAFAPLRVLNDTHDHSASKHPMLPRDSTACTTILALFSPLALFKTSELPEKASRIH